MRYRKINSLLILSLSMLFIYMVCSSSQQVLAEVVPVSVQAVLPKNQINSDVTYFDLKMEPSQKQTIEVLLHNSSEEKVNINTKITSALTNTNGLIDYTLDNGDEKNYDASLKYPLTKIAKVKNQVEMAPKEKVKLPITIQMPTSEYDGMILGAICFSPESTSSNTNQNTNNSMQIKTTIEYSIGIVLRETNQKVEPKVNLIKVNAGQTMGMNVVKASVQNSTSTVIEDMVYDAKVYKEKGNKVLFEKKNTNYRLAPNTNVNYEIPLNDKAFKPGKYRLELLTKGKNEVDEEKEWRFTEYFIITKDQAKKLNEKAVNLEEKSNIIYYLIAGLIGIVGVLLLFYWRNKTKKKVKKRRKRMKNE